MAEQPAAKKKRTFIDESDVFDFSNMNKVVKDDTKKSEVLAPKKIVSKESSSSQKFDDDALGNFFTGKSV